MRIERVVLAGLVACVAAASGLAAQEQVALARAASAGCTPAPVPDPPTMKATDARLRMAPHSYTVGGTRYSSNVYNDNFLGPTLTMNPGERLKLSVTNAMAVTDSQPAAQIAWTNLHYHGLVVTPSPDSADNVTHVHIDRGAPPRPYHFPVPEGHPEGMFWYHPHPHGISTSQVGGGLSGALLVGNVLDYFPQYKGVRERVLLIRDMGFTISSSVLNVNGGTCALLPVRAGERQLWHIGNFGSNTFVNLKLDSMKWTLLAMDGNRLAEPQEVDSLWIPPGSRAEVIVTGPRAGKRVRLYSASFLPRTARGDTASTTLGYLVGLLGAPPRREGPRMAGADAQVLDSLRFLREARDPQKHTFTFDFVGNDAGINDSIYQPNHLPVAIPWGRVQEWTLVNTTRSLHTFHIHQVDFEVISVNGVEVKERMLRDNVPLGVHLAPDGKTVVGDTVVVRFVFDPIAAGPFVFHCHVLQHEDEGMMHNVCVYDPNDPDGVNKCNAMFSGGGHGGH